jgi:hypothetical protein
MREVKADGHIKADGRGPTALVLTPTGQTATLVAPFVERNTNPFLSPWTGARSRS